MSDDLERPNWKDYFKKIVLVTRERSPCVKDLIGMCSLRIIES